MITEELILSLRTKYVGYWSGAKRKYIHFGRHQSKRRYALGLNPKFNSISLRRMVDFSNVKLKSYPQTLA
jgi:hypothetical protein